MRYNERELLSLARQPAEKAAEILMRAPKKGSGKEKGGGDGVTSRPGAPGIPGTSRLILYPHNNPVR